jgi:C1A family cysteine protease
MASKETDQWILRPTTFIEAEGTFLRAALEVARNFGNVADKELPFRSGKLFMHDYKTFYTMAANLRIAMYHNLGRDLKVWRRWLATEGPILTRLDVDKTWDNVGKTGKLGKYVSATARGGHAVALVGYTKDHFVVRNSWGDYWADDGFAYASNEYAKEAFTEAYGVRI